MLHEMFFRLEFFGIGLVLVLLSFEKSTNTNTIPAFGIVFQYNTIRIVHLWHGGIPMMVGSIGVADNSAWAGLGSNLSISLVTFLYSHPHSKWSS